MGLFDFITKSSGSDDSQQSVQDDGTQNPQSTQMQNGRLVESPFSNVKYPLPADSQVNQTQLQQPQNISQQSATDLDTQGQPFNQSFQPQVTTGFDQAQPMGEPIKLL